MGEWPEVTTAKSENRHEIKLAGSAISKRIAEEGLDKSVFQLTSINLLNISDTCLEILPDDIKCLVNLQSLLLYGNKIKDFNVNITSLKKLKVLDLSRNQIATIPDDINEMKELMNINLNSNQIETLPKLTDFPNLISIDLSNNKLKSFLDVEDAKMPHLTDLKLNGNVIDSVPGYLAKSLPSLKNFDIGDNQISTVPAELANLSKLKEFNLKGNKMADKRLMKLVDQCRTKQILDYIRDHCPKQDASQPTGGKGKNKKTGKKNDESSEQQNAESELCHLLKILHVEDNIPKIKIIDSQVAQVRPYILCCIVHDLNFTDVSFKKFIQLQTKLHDTVCEKRNLGTIATHDLAKIAPGDLTYGARAPGRLVLRPLGRARPLAGDQLFAQLTAEAEALRKEKKRNVYTGIHKYLYLLEGKPKYPYLEDASGKVISFPPITNSEDTKMSSASRAMLVEVTSQSAGACRGIMDAMLRECLLQGVGGEPGGEGGEPGGEGGEPGGEGGEPGGGAPKFHSLTVQQVKVVDLEGNLKSVYPSRTDCEFNDPAVRVLRGTAKK